MFSRWESTHFLPSVLLSREAEKSAFFVTPAPCVAHGPSQGGSTGQGGRGAASQGWEQLLGMGKEGEHGWGGVAAEQEPWEAFQGKRSQSRAGGSEQHTQSLPRAPLRALAQLWWPCCSDRDSAVTPQNTLHPNPRAAPLGPL